MPTRKADRRDKPTFLEAVTTKAVLAIGRMLAYKAVLNGGEGYEAMRPVVVDSEDKANLVSSFVGKYNDNGQALHAPVLDLDFPAHLVPSSTPGHYHLYLDTLIPWDKYERLLVALAEAGIIELGYADASVKHQTTYVRLPYVKKSD